MAGIKLKGLFISERAFFAEDKKLNIIGIFDEVFVQGFPAIQPFMSLAGLLEGEPNKDISLKIELINSDGKTINSSNLKPHLSSSGTANFVVNIPGLPINKKGELVFKVFNEDKVIGQTSLRVVVVSKGEEDAGRDIRN